MSDGDSNPYSAYRVNLFPEGEQGEGVLTPHSTFTIPLILVSNQIRADAVILPVVNIHILTDGADRWIVDYVLTLTFTESAPTIAERPPKAGTYIADQEQDERGSLFAITSVTGSRTSRVAHRCVRRRDPSSPFLTSSRYKSGPTPSGLDRHCQVPDPLHRSHSRREVVPNRSTPPYIFNDGSHKMPKQSNAIPAEGFLHPESSYTFRLDQYRVAHTRSPHNDTNVVGYTLAFGGQSYTQTLPPTDVNDGNHDIGLEFPGVRIPDPTTLITVAFTIVNAGHNSSAVETALKTGVDKLITAEAGPGSVWGAAAQTAVDLFLADVLADCDGAVAAASMTAARSAFDGLIPTGGRMETPTTAYPGTDSSAGCGGNSSYYVTQTVIRAQIGDVSGPDVSKLFIIAGRSSGLVLDIPGGVSTAGVQIQQYPDNGTIAQHWRLAETDSGYFMIGSAVNGLVLEVANNSSADHAAIQLANPTNAENQQWMFEPVSVPPPDLPFPVLANTNTYYRIRSRSSGKVLDVPARSADPQVKIQQFSAASSDYNNQVWQMMAIADVPLVVGTGQPAPPPIFRGERVSPAGK